MSKKVVVAIIVLAGLGFLGFIYIDRLPLPEKWKASSNRSVHDPDDSEDPDLSDDGEPQAPEPAPEIKVSSKPRITVRVLPRDVRRDPIAIQKDLRDRTELTVIGLPAKGKLSVDAFEVIDQEGERHPVLGFLIYRFDGNNWHRSDEDVRSPRKMALLQQGAGGLTYSMYQEGKVDVDQEQAVVLFVPEPKVRGRLFFKGDELNVVYDTNMTPPRTDPAAEPETE